MAPKSPTSPSKRRKSSTAIRRNSSKLPSPSPPHQPRSPSAKPIKQEPVPPNPESANPANPESPSSSPPPFEPVEKARQPTPPWHARKSWQFGPEAFAGPVTPGRFKGRQRSSGVISPKGRVSGSRRSLSSRKSSPSPRKSVSFEEGRRERAYEVGSPPALVGAGYCPGWRPLLPTTTRDASASAGEGEAGSSSEERRSPGAMRVAKVEPSPPFMPTTRTSSASLKSPSPLRKSEPRSSSVSRSPPSPSPPQAIIRPGSSTPSRAQFSPLQLDQRRSSSPFAPTSPPYGSSSGKSVSKSSASPARSKKASVYSPTSPPLPNARLPTYSPTRPGVGLGIRSPGINASLRSPGPYVADDERKEGEFDEPTPRTLRRKRVEHYSSSPSSDPKSSSRSRSRSRSTSLPRASYRRTGFQRRSSPCTPSPATSSSSSQSRRSGSGSQPASPLGRLFRVIGEVWRRERSQSKDSSDAADEDDSADEEVWDSLFVAASQGYRALVRRVERLLETHGIHHMLSLLARHGHGGDDGVFRTQWRFALRYVGEPEVDDREEALILTKMLLDEVEGLEEQFPRHSIDIAIRRWEQLVARFMGDEDDPVLDLDQERRLQFEDAVGDFARALGFYAFAQVFNSSHPGEATFLFGNLVRENGENEPQTFYYPAEPLWIRAVVGAILADEDIGSLRPNAAGETADYPEWYEIVQYEVDWLHVLEDAEEGAEETMIRDTGTEVEALALIEELVEGGTAWGSIFRMLREHVRMYGLETLVRQTFADLSAPVAEALRRDPRAAALELGRLTPTRYDLEDNVAALIADEMAWMRRHRAEAAYPPELVGSWEPSRGVDANNWARRVIQGLREENDDLTIQLRERNQQLVEAQREVARSYDQEYHLQQRIADLGGPVERLRARREGSQDAELRCRICGRTFAGDEEGQEDLEHHTELHRRTIQQYELLESEGWLDALDDLDLTPRLGARRPSSLAFPSRRSSSRSAGSKRKSFSSHYTDDERGSRSASFASLVQSPNKRRRRRTTEVSIPRQSIGSSVESLRSSEKTSSAGGSRRTSSVRSSHSTPEEEEEKEEKKEEVRLTLRRSSRIAKLQQKKQK